jgi:hypothetical protein
LFPLVVLLVSPGGVTRTESSISISAKSSPLLGETDGVGTFLLLSKRADFLSGSLSFLIKNKFRESLRLSVRTFTSILHFLTQKVRNPEMKLRNLLSPDYYIFYSFRIPGSGARFLSVATQDRVFPHYVLNSSIKHSKSDSKDRSQEIL